MKLIKNALVYRINLPAAALLAGHLAEIAYREIGEFDVWTAGFVPVLDDNLVSTFEGGLAFSLRYDEKILPGAAVKTELAKRVKRIEVAEGRRVGRKEQREMRESVITDLLRTSHVRSQVITSFYHIASRLLIVPVSSAKLAALVTSLLVRAVGAAKTETINISDVKGGLTARLKLKLQAERDGDENADAPFGEFDLAPDVWLKGEQGKVTFQVDSIHTGDRGIAEALDAGMQVIAVRLGYGPVSFKITSDFSFKGVRFEEASEPPEHECAADHWKHEAGVQVFSMVEAIEALCVLFDYVTPAEEVAA